MIYLDSAATSFHKPKEVAEAVYDAILHMGNSGRSGHEISLHRWFLRQIPPKV